MRLGFVGTGTIAKAIVTGICTADCPVSEIVLSPRSAHTAAELAETYERARVAQSNQAVLDESDLVILSVRPQVARAVLGDLSFRVDHEVLSLIAGFTHAMLKPIVAPASRIVRAAPLPAVAMLMGPTAIYPKDDTVRTLFAAMGVTVEVDTTDEFDALLAVTAEMASFFALLGTCADWLAEKGVGRDRAGRFVAMMYRGLTETAVREKHLSFSELLEEHMTKGGLNEQVWRELGASGCFESHKRALDNIVVRIRGAD